ncbi:MAG: Rsd/AlgQ family anti-sigma factor [Gammaproteobacteria bacterium HGW-Gammaproteobacteria-3]|nr:MAG: Rsd/AlgQ family anti-sigma factor [Gammaproteobacteria bacterium HGW-Gammaproteobacteria-3]
MTTATQPKTEKRQHSSNLIKELKTERHEVWKMYCRIAELGPFSANQKVRDKLIEFSQLLVDYVALGHFGIYERLLAGNERRSAVLSLAEKLYPDLSKTTDAAIAFNDKYENITQELIKDELQQDLSILGESLALRINLEDSLCDMLLR